MERYASCIRLNPNAVRSTWSCTPMWPAVEAMITAANIRNYTIFLHGDMLFSYYEYIGADHAADQARIAADPATQRWWQLTDPLPGKAARHARRPEMGPDDGSLSPEPMREFSTRICTCGIPVGCDTRGLWARS